MSGKSIDKYDDMKSVVICRSKRSMHSIDLFFTMILIVEMGSSYHDIKSILSLVLSKLFTLYWMCV